MTNSALRALSRVLIMVACIVTGECGSVVPQAALPVAIVAMNRLDAGMGYDGWHAIADEPTDWAMDAAWEAYWRGGDASGDLFALGKKDMEALGFDPDAPWWMGICSPCGRWCSYVGRRWE